MTEPWRRIPVYAGGPSVLNTRSLATGHRRLEELLRPGLSVLDVGCGPGAITREIAEAVASGGRAVGADLNERLVEEARRTHADVHGLTFEVCDVYDLPYRKEFDIVTAARVLQWLARPLDALRMMVRAAKPGGRVVVLDYNHARTSHTPEPPPTMQTFQAAFLRWRAQAGLDNEIAEHLAGMFASAGLLDVVEIPQLETARRGDLDFHIRAGIWAETAAFHGPRMVEDGVLTEQERAAAEADYRQGSLRRRRHCIWFLSKVSVRSNGTVFLSQEALEGDRFDPLACSAVRAARNRSANRASESARAASCSRTALTRRQATGTLDGGQHGLA